MATRKSKRPIKRKLPYERPPVLSNDPSTWNKKKLIKELKEIGIEVPVDLSESILLQLFKSNVDSRRNDSDVNIIDNDKNSETETRARESQQQPLVNTTPEENQLNNLCNVFVSMSQCVTGLQNTVTQLLQNSHTDKLQDSGKEGFTLGKWYAQTNTLCSNISHSVTQENSLPAEINSGVRSDLFQNIDVVSPSLQRQIIDGKDVNLAALLIPSYECPQSHTVIADTIEVNLPGKPDIRLSRTLTIQEFIKAFGKYKRIMSKAYPERRAELDSYEEDIVEISNFYGAKFYDYHKMFSAKAATLLREYKVKVDWSKRDRDLFTLVSAGVQINVCKLCHMCDHSTEFCSLQLKYKINSQENNSLRSEDRSDKYGRQRFYQQGREICNNFNSNRGCTKRSCSFLHICTKCRSSGHSQLLCAKRQSATTVSNQIASVSSADKETPKSSHKL